VTRHHWTALTLLVGMYLLIFTAYGRDKFLWTVFGGLLILFVVSVVEAVRKWGD
jgi:hypothetical protein